MRKVIYILLFISFNARSQTPEQMFYALAGADPCPFVAYDADAQNYFNWKLAQGYVMTCTEKTASNNYIISLKANGFWSMSGAEFHPLMIGGGIAAAHLVTLKGLVSPSALGTLTWSTNGVIATSGGSVNTNYVPSVHMTLNSSSFWFYSRTSSTIGASAVDMGCNSGSTAEMLLIARRSNGNSHTCQYRQSAPTGLITTTLITNGSGLFGSNRNSTTYHAIYQNGSPVATQVTTNTGTLSTQALYLSANNNNGTANAHTTRNYSMWIALPGISDAQAVTLNTITETFHDELGIGIQ